MRIRFPLVHQASSFGRIKVCPAWDLECNTFVRNGESFPTDPRSMIILRKKSTSRFISRRHPSSWCDWYIFLLRFKVLPFRKVGVYSLKFRVWPLHILRFKHSFLFADFQIQSLRSHPLTFNISLQPGESAHYDAQVQKMQCWKVNMWNHFANDEHWATRSNDSQLKEFKLKSRLISDEFWATRT